MKILQLVTKRQYRGAEVFAANLSRELVALGHEIIFAGLYRNDSDALYVDKASNVDIAELKTSSFSLPLVNKLIKLIKKSKPDIIQCNGSDTLKYMFAASFFTPEIPVLYRNISIISEWVKSKPKKILYKNVFKRIDHVTSVGDEAVEDFIFTFGYPPARISVIRRGIPIKEITDKEVLGKYRNELGIAEEDKIAVHVGNFSAEKNHDFLLDLFEKIKKENSSVKLLCVGTGDLYEVVKQNIKDRGLENTVFLFGFRRDIPEILAVSDCFVLSSKIEGVPGVILEAATQRKPSVATDVGGVSEVLLNGETGFLIKDFCIEDFKEKLLNILYDDKLRQRLGENAFNLVFDQFNPVKNAVRFEELYQQLIKRKKA